MTEDAATAPETEAEAESPKTLEQRVSKLIDLDAEATRLKGEAGANSKLIQTEKAAILDLMAASGTTKITMKGKTAYFFRQIWAKNLGTKEQTIEALRSCGLDTMVSETFNSSTLSSHIRQLETDEDDNPIMPPELAAAVGISEKLDVRLVSAKSK